MALREMPRNDLIGSGPRMVMLQWGRAPTLSYPQSPRPTIPVQGNIGLGEAIAKEQDTNEKKRAVNASVREIVLMIMKRDLCILWAGPHGHRRTK